MEETEKKKKKTKVNKCMQARKDRKHASLYSRLLVRNLQKCQLNELFSEMIIGQQKFLWSQALLTALNKQLKICAQIKLFSILKDEHIMTNSISEI